MSREPRNSINTIFTHVMVQGLNKEFIFEKDEDKEEYIRLITKIKKDVCIEIISYCIMSNHVHMLTKEESNNILSEFMHKLNTLYGIYYNKKYNRVGYVFRGRFKSQQIYSEKQLYTCINYIHNNPVKANICKLPQEYKYSSYIEYSKNSKNFASTINNLNEHKKSNADIIFLEDENEREEEIQLTIKKYLYNNKLNLEKLKNNKKYLAEIIKILRDDYSLSLRKISDYIEVGRETVRKISREVCENKH